MVKVGLVTTCHEKKQWMGSQVKMRCVTTVVSREWSQRLCLYVLAHETDGIGRRRGVVIVEGGFQGDVKR